MREFGIVFLITISGTACALCSGIAAHSLAVVLAVLAGELFVMALVAVLNDTLRQIRGPLSSPVAAPSERP